MRTRRRVTRRNRGGATLVELLFGVLLLGGLVALVMQNLRFQTLSQELVEKLDVLQRLRLAELRLRAELETGTAVLHPHAGDESGVGSLVFADPENRLRIVYLDRAGNLKLRSRGEEPVVLCEQVLDFLVRHPFPGQVECVIRADSPDRGRVSALVAGHVGNHFHASGVEP